MGIGFYSIISIPTTLIFVHLIANYWNYYEIGINAAANSWSLIFFVAPLMFILFTASGYIFSRFVPQGRIKQTASLSLGILGIIITFIIGFIVISGEFSNYPSPVPRNFLDFLRYYFRLAPKKVIGFIAQFHLI
ncbi:hypothetical protein NOS3756_51250 [Nostoc sp. NIES-3756]|uniref:hypothetical protein n=1 Tax=Nostoc sp. NIES-3756 TaxID=1751286 RepID=UPI00071F8972|nr:hypothetical protein [Nostoc sp. NIES-3756]BAT56123.1 hypothetical protein NOS3756_51250 [Nostoc sp. NIES-3756]